MEEHATGLSGSGRATCECWGPVGQVVLDAILGEKPKYKESAQKEESSTAKTHSTEKEESVQ
jgi:hypothetical protein